MTRDVLRTGLEYNGIHRTNTEGKVTRMWKWLHGDIRVEIKWAETQEIRKEKLNTKEDWVREILNALIC